MKTSEKRLLGVFVALLLIAGNFFLYEMVKSRRDQVELQRSVLEERRLQLQELLGARATWQDRRDWIDGKLKGYQTIDVRDTFLVSLINQSAAEAGVTVDKGPNPLAARDEGTYEETLVDAEVVGLIEPVVRFLFLLQDPTAFRSITSLQMEPARRGDDGEEIRCEVTVAQRWARGFAAGEPGFTSPEPATAGPDPGDPPATAEGEEADPAAPGSTEEPGTEPGDGDGDGTGTEPGSEPGSPGDGNPPVPDPGPEPPTEESGSDGDPERLTAAVVQPQDGGNAVTHPIVAAGFSGVPTPRSSPAHA